MARILIVDDVTVCAFRESTHVGPYIDFLQAHWPNGFDRPNAHTLNGQPLTPDQFDVPLAQDDVVTVGFAPGGAEPISWLVAAIIVVVSVAATFLLMPRPPGRIDEASAGSVYSVTNQANRAKIGAPVPVCYGEVYRTPEYATQSHRVFRDNQEVRFFLLSLAANAVQLDQLYIGETPVTELPPGIARYAVYGPSEHLQTMGTIAADMNANDPGFTGAGDGGFHENVYTSGDVENIELNNEVAAVGDRGRASISKSGAIVSFAVEPPASLVTGAGFQVCALDGLNICFSYTAAADPVLNAGVWDVEVNETGSPDYAARLSSFTVNAVSLSSRTYRVNPDGTDVERVEIDLEAPGGFYLQNDDGSFATLTETINVTLFTKDSVGSLVQAYVHSVTFSAGTKTHQRQTFGWAVAPDQYWIQVRRVGQSDVTARDQDLLRFTGLRGYGHTPASIEAYGNSVLVALQLVGSEQISGSSQSRIFARTRSILTPYGGGAAAVSANPADVIRDLYVNADYGSGLGLNGLDAVTLAALETKGAAVSGFNGVFDSKGTLLEAVEAVAALVRAKPVPINGRLGFVFDDVKATRAAVFTPENMTPDSLAVQFNWLEEGAPDGVEVVYRALIDFSERTVRFPIDCIRPRRVEIVGLVNETEAAAYAQYLWKQETLRNVAGEFETLLEGQLLLPLMRIGVCDPAFDWANSAQVHDVTGQLVTLDRDVAAGSMVVSFRDVAGGQSANFSAVADGSNVIDVTGDLSGLVFQTDGARDFTHVAIERVADAILDALVINVVPVGGGRVRVEFQNYDENVVS